MTEILVNELSLSGQFDSVDEFITGGALFKFNTLLNEMKTSNVLLYKSHVFFESMATKDVSIYDLLFGSISRQYDEIRKMKSGLACLLEEPYWENNQKHSPDILYIFNNECVTGKSLAEACERDKITVSFSHQSFIFHHLSIMREENEIVLDNLYKENDYIDLAWKRSLIGCEEYCIKKYKRTKLDFSKMESGNGFSILGKDDENLFIDGFRKFTELTWPQINVDVALEYKEYNDNKGYFKSYKRKIHKFRISRKYRCFGYVENGIFFALFFDLTHKLSDFG